MAKKKTDQVNFRAGALLPRLESVADLLGLDMSNLVRMIISENLHTYEARVEQIRKTLADRATAESDADD